MDLSVLKLDGSAKTPSIYFDADKGVVELKGRSIPENAIDFYRPLIDWLNKYSATPKSTTEVNVQLEYFNTSSSKCILDVFKKLEAIYRVNKGVVINWFYEEDDEDMLAAGEDYQSILKIPFKMVEITE